jgi:hypothetical protein
MLSFALTLPPQEATDRTVEHANAGALRKVSFMLAKIRLISLLVKHLQYSRRYVT